MIEVRCDKLEIKDPELKSNNEIDVTKSPICQFDFDYTTVITKDEFILNLCYSMVVKDEDKLVFTYRLPCILTYTQEKYQVNGFHELLECALLETKMIAYANFELPISAYFIAKMKFFERSLH